MQQKSALLQALASELRSRRSALKFSQEELAHRAGVNRTYVAKLELAQNQPTIGVLYRLSLGLGCELPELIKSVMDRLKQSIQAG